MDNIIKALIIDDEELARELVKNYVKSIPEIEIIGECSNGFEGIKSNYFHRRIAVYICRSLEIGASNYGRYMPCIVHKNHKRLILHYRVV